MLDSRQKLHHAYGCFDGLRCTCDVVQHATGAQHSLAVPSGISKQVVMQDRVHAFNRWLQGRPEKVIVAFGHSSFWCEFLGGRTRLKNCELHTHFV